ncbi:MAG: DUF6629 family protein [Kofleriaceae bacterium]
MAPIVWSLAPVVGRHVSRFGVCLSPEVSFSLAGSLLVVGTYCLEKAIRTDRSWVPMALVPLVFGAQQFCEGWVWTGLHRGDARLVTIAASTFLFFALCFWPVWIPFSMLLVERGRKAKLLLYTMTSVGLAMGAIVMVPLVFRPSWLHVDVEAHSLHYNVDSSPAFRVLPNLVWQVLYFVVVATPLLVSTHRKIVHFGMMLILTAAATHILLPHTFASAWCCFAAAMSLYIVTLFYRLPRPRRADLSGAAG